MQPSCRKLTSARGRPSPTLTAGPHSALGTSRTGNWPTMLLHAGIWPTMLFRWPTGHKCYFMRVSCLQCYFICCFVRANCPKDYDKFHLLPYVCAPAKSRQSIRAPRWQKVRHRPAETGPNRYDLPQETAIYAKKLFIGNISNQHFTPPRIFFYRKGCAYLKKCLPLQPENGTGCQTGNSHFPPAADGHVSAVRAPRRTLLTNKKKHN